MTTRDEARRRVDVRGDSREDDRDFAVPEPAGSLPERLLAARERKGVDLYRAERDTKIRARYLAALERGDYRELPGAVYTKGFLRNYALYLGLDPEDAIRQWKRERGDAAVPAEPVLAVPKPLAAPRPGLSFSPAVVVAALMTVGVVLFGVYLAFQLLRYAKPPTLEVTSPATAVLEVSEDTTSYTLRGTSIPGATITVTVAGRDQPYRVSADDGGRWVVDVELRRGRNSFDITALDPDTGKTADAPKRVFITVPFLVIEAPTLTLDSPAEGARFENGAIPVKGATTNARSVTVKAEWLGPADGQPVPSPGPSASAPAGPVPVVTPVTVDVADDGAFETPLDLTAGLWRVTVTAESAEGKTASLSREVAVEYQGVNLVVQIRGSRAWLKVWVDGKLDPEIGQSGLIVAAGKTLTFTGLTSVEVRTGSSGSTFFTLNGTSYGALGNRGVPETWLFEPPNDPVNTGRK
jgi:cytoskeletal protein RodZ